MLKKLYAKSEIWFAVAWIVAYVVLASTGDNISEALGISKIVTLPILIALSALTLYNTHYLNSYTKEMTTLLKQAEHCAADGDWDAAADKTEAALDRWKCKESYLHTVLQHRDTDNVLLAFQEVRQLIAHQEDGGEYSAANAKLIAQIELLYEMEQLNWKNLL